MTAPLSPPLPGDVAAQVAAREAALREWRFGNPDAPWSPDHNDAFRDGWGNNGLSVTWLPSLEEANIAGRRAARAYQRTPQEARP